MTDSHDISAINMYERLKGMSAEEVAEEHHRVLGPVLVTAEAELKEGCLIDSLVMSAYPGVDMDAIKDLYEGVLEDREVQDDEDDEVPAYTPDRFDIRLMMLNEPDRVSFHAVMVCDGLGVEGVLTSYTSVLAALPGASKDRTYIDSVNFKAKRAGDKVSLEVIVSGTPYGVIEALTDLHTGRII